VWRGLCDGCVEKNGNAATPNRADFAPQSAVELEGPPHVVGTPSVDEFSAKRREKKKNQQKKKNRRPRCNTHPSGGRIDVGRPLIRMPQVHLQVCGHGHRIPSPTLELFFDGFTGWNAGPGPREAWAERRTGASTPGYRDAAMAAHLGGESAVGIGFTVPFQPLMFASV